MDQIKKKILDLFDNDKRMTYLALLLAILLVVFKMMGIEDELPKKRKFTQVDTIIPKGFVLNPIEVANSKAAQSLIENYGLVDLYISSKASMSSKSIPIARSLKIIRAPSNPEQFAVLVRPEMADVINSYSGPFRVVIKNPKHQSSQQMIERHKKRKIYYMN